MSTRSAEISSLVWPDSESGDTDAPKKRRKSRRGGRNRNRGGEHESINIQANKREYHARELGTALIWSRDPKDADRALIKSDLTESAPSDEIASEDATDHKQLVEHANQSTEALKTLPALNSDVLPVDRPSSPVVIQAAQQTENLESIPSQGAQEYAWATLDHEPAPDAQRAFFWNTADQVQADHDALPAITEETNEKIDTGSQKQPELPSLDQAINPNVEAPLGPARADNPLQDDLTTHFLSRQPNTPAVQSQQMTAQNFEQLAADPVSDEAALPGELYVQDELTSRPTNGADYLATATAPALETTAWPGFSAAQNEVAASYETPNNAERGPIDHALNGGELQTLAKSIHVDGVSVYEMFTANRIDEEGLRRIVSSYLRGNELRQTIAQEVVRQQMKFERDPQLRETPVKVSGGESSKNTTDRIKQGTINLLDPEFAKEQTEKIGELTQNAIEKSQEFFSGGTNIGRYASIAAIVIIYTLIVIVALSR